MKNKKIIQEIDSKNYGKISNKDEKITKFMRSQSTKKMDLTSNIKQNEMDKLLISSPTTIKGSRISYVS